VLEALCGATLGLKPEPKTGVQLPRRRQSASGALWKYPGEHIVADKENGTPTTRNPLSALHSFMSHHMTPANCIGCQTAFKTDCRGYRTQVRRECSMAPRRLFPL
jgi:hypothetical protein